MTTLEASLLGGLILTLGTLIAAIIKYFSDEHKTKADGENKDKEIDGRFEEVKLASSKATDAALIAAKTETDKLVEARIKTVFEMMDSQIKRGEERFAALETKYETVMTMCDDLKAKNEELTAEVARYRQEAADAKRTAEIAQREASQAKKERDDAVRHVRELEKRVTELEKQLGERSRLDVYLSSTDPLLDVDPN